MLQVYPEYRSEMASHASSLERSVLPLLEPLEASTGAKTPLNGASGVKTISVFRLVERAAGVCG